METNGENTGKRKTRSRRGWNTTITADTKCRRLSTIGTAETAGNNTILLKTKPTSSIMHKAVPAAVISGIITGSMDICSLS